MLVIAKDRIRRPGIQIRQRGTASANPRQFRRQAAAGARPADTVQALLGGTANRRRDGLAGQRSKLAHRLLGRPVLDC